MRRLWLAAILAAFLSSSASAARAQSTDFTHDYQSWLQLTLQGPIHQDLFVQSDLQYRAYDDVSPAQILIRGALAWRPIDNMYLGLGYGWTLAFARVMVASSSTSTASTRTGSGSSCTARPAFASRCDVESRSVFAIRRAPPRSECAFGRCSDSRFRSRQTVCSRSSRTTSSSSISPRAVTPSRAWTRWGMTPSPQRGRPSATTRIGSSSAWELSSFRASSGSSSAT
ncbi:MAG: DUF2490 domain-containing protein [Deltaproteobacteria bacterium]|nr:DUF2490 domain-containing protein [Deltaproteobacteria bacterium]